MFDQFALQLALSITGKKPGPLFTEMTGMSIRAGERLSKFPEGDTRIRRSVVAQFARVNECSMDEAIQHFADLPSVREQRPSPLADYVAISPRFDQSRKNYARSLRLAQELDEYSRHYMQLRSTEDGFTKFREYLLATGHGKPEFFADLNERDFDAPRLWSEFHAAQSWEDARASLHAFIWNALLDWLACWDLEFCMDWIPNRIPNPLFTLVTPSVSEEILEQETVTLDKKRNWYRLPIDRLIDVTSVLVSGVRNRSIPKKKPLLKTFAAWARVEPQWLANVRTGERKLTLRRFCSLWETAIVRGTDPNIGPPIPLFVAAHAFTVLLVRQHRPGHIAQIVTVNEDRYRTMWKSHRDAVIEAGAKPGTRPWPKILG
ncbi:hypothetical protein [Burkholderia sp. MSMB1498]|uniref:hypothetical protein n=1 Tax=Burkholderia sp. MSMB1498 TaxID=1637842 RepID=UPI00075E9D8E|nr:hypothetical protein [Burkholderia sp. MSMB1498]KVK77958.1 hypothetical protein WS91_16035 [Burkholderia sp. MSMB1498]